MKRVILCLCIIILFKCSFEKGAAGDEEPKKIQEIEIRDESYDNSYNNVLDIKRIIQLETTTQSVVGSIDKIITYKNKIFVLDSEQAKSVFCFADNGSFLFKIDNIGKGPGEFTKPHDFDINIINEQIQILDSYLQKILRYDMAGNFIDEVKLPIQTMSFCSFNESDYLLHMDGRDSIGEHKLNLFHIWDRKDGLQQSSVYDYGSTDAEAINSEYIRFKDVIHFVHAWTDTIYSYNGNGIQPIYAIDFGRSRATDELKRLDLMGMMNYFKTNSLRVHTGNLCETDNLIAISWLHQKKAGDVQNYTTYYDKGTLKTFTVSQQRNLKDSVSILGPLTTMGDDFIGVLDGDISEIKRLSSIGGIGQLEINENVEINPVLVRYQLDDSIFKN